MTTATRLSTPKLLTTLAIVLLALPAHSGAPDLAQPSQPSTADLDAHTTQSARPDSVQRFQSPATDLNAQPSQSAPSNLPIRLSKAATPPPASNPYPPDLDLRLSQVVSIINHALPSSPMPGLVIGITDRHALRKVIAYGFADLKTRAPVTPDSRFAIGSVSKAFTAISLMQLSEEGHFDPHAPITRYLPSLTLHSTFAPITGRDLMSHTSGLPNYLPDSASSRYAAVELADFQPTYAPGAHWAYSNTGYQLLGYVLENIEQKPYTEIIQRRVLDRVGMPATSAVIDDAERTRMVVSYTRWPEDGNYVEATWFEYSAGDGSLVSTAADMCAYMRFILNKGAGDKARVLSESAFTTLTTPILNDYAYGLWVRHKDGHTVIAHTGGIAGFRSDVEAHMDDGFGLVILTSGGLDNVWRKWISQNVTAAFEGEAFIVPPAPSPAQPDLHEYVGHYQLGTPGPASDPHATLEFAVDNGHLILKTDRDSIPLERMGTDTFRATGKAADTLALRSTSAGPPESIPFFFARAGDDAHGKVVEVSHGTSWYVTDGFSGKPAPAVPKEYAAYIGHFVNNGPEGPVARVYVRNGQLMMMVSMDEDATPEPLTPLSPGVFRIGKEDYSPERARFDSLVDGHALRLLITGVPLYRKDTP